MDPGDKGPEGKKAVDICWDSMIDHLTAIINKTTRPRGHGVAGSREWTHFVTSPSVEMGLSLDYHYEAEKNKNHITYWMGVRVNLPNLAERFE